MDADQEVAKCTFCKKPVNEVLALISGEETTNGKPNICDECIVGCCDVLAERWQVPPDHVLEVAKYRHLLIRVRAAQQAAKAGPGVGIEPPWKPEPVPDTVDPQ